MFGSIDCHAVKSGYLDARISPFLLFRKQHKPNQSPEPGPQRIQLASLFRRFSTELLVFASKCYMGKWIQLLESCRFRFDFYFTHLLNTCDLWSCGPETYLSHVQDGDDILGCARGGEGHTKALDFHIELEKWGPRSFSSLEGVEPGHAYRRIKAVPPIGVPYTLCPSNSMSMPSVTDIHSRAKMPVLWWSLKY